MVSPEPLGKILLGTEMNSIAHETSSKTPKLMNASLQALLSRKIEGPPASRPHFQSTSLKHFLLLGYKKKKKHLALPHSFVGSVKSLFA